MAIGTAHTPASTMDGGAARYPHGNAGLNVTPSSAAHKSLRRRARLRPYPPTIAAGSLGRSRDLLIVKRVGLDPLGIHRAAYLACWVVRPHHAWSSGLLASAARSPTQAHASALVLKRAFRQTFSAEYTEYGPSASARTIITPRLRCAKPVVCASWRFVGREPSRSQRPPARY